MPRDYGTRGSAGRGTSPYAPSSPLFDPTFYNDIASTAYNNDVNRVPMGSELETASSNAIAALLNPPSFFPDVNRHAAELAASQGISGSPAAGSSLARMTDEERLRRISLGEQFLSGAYARREAPPNVLSGAVTPAQQAQLDLERRRQLLAENQFNTYQNRLNTPSVTYSGGGGGGGVHPYPTYMAPTTTRPQTGGTGNSLDYLFNPPPPLQYNLPPGYTPGAMYPNPSAPLLPLSPGGPIPGQSGQNQGDGYDGSENIIPGLDSSNEDLQDFLYYGGYPG